jgi:hypothetical protein
MTAHDDDQDLVTIRVPRRAAAMYAAELDASSTPLAVTLSATLPYLVALVVALAGLVAGCASLSTLLRGDQDWPIDVGGIVVGCMFLFGGAAATKYAGQYRRSLRSRGLL